MSASSARERKVSSNVENVRDRVPPGQDGLVDGTPGVLGRQWLDGTAGQGRELVPHRLRQCERVMGQEPHRLPGRRRGRRLGRGGGHERQGRDRGQSTQDALFIGVVHGSPPGWSAGMDHREPTSLGGDRGGRPEQLVGQATGRAGDQGLGMQRVAQVMRGDTLDRTRDGEERHQVPSLTGQHDGARPRVRARAPDPRASVQDRHVVAIQTRVREQQHVGERVVDARTTERSQDGDGARSPLECGEDGELGVALVLVGARTPDLGAGRRETDEHGGVDGNRGPPPRCRHGRPHRAHARHPRRHR